MTSDPTSRTHSHFPANPQGKEGYRLTFCDDFDKPELAADKWFPHHLPQWSSRDDTKARYTFQDNHLLLHIEKNQRPWSEEFNGALRVSSLQTGCFSGPIGSNRGQHPFRDDLVVREEQPNG